MAKTIKIFYQHVFDHGVYPFASDAFAMEPYPKIKDHHSSEIYYDCPAWSHKAKRTFVVKSPMDFHFQVTPMKTSNGVEHYLRSSNLSQKMYDNIVVLDSEWYSENVVTVQLAITQMYFWSNHKKIWMDLRPHPATVMKNNLTTVGGWFSISAWGRPTSFAFNVIDPEKPIIIKRGDPIYELCFYSQDLNDSFVLEKSVVDEKRAEEWKMRTSLKYFQRKLSAKYMFGQQEKESKCPFSFLWKDKK